MKFDYVIGNPPYQQESEKKSEVNGQTRRKNVFQHFQTEADKIANSGSVLIYPGARWIHQSGKGVEQFGKDLINDARLSCLEFFPNASEVFGNEVAIADGITIVVKNQNKKSKGFEYSYVCNGSVETVEADNPGSDLMPLNPKDIQILNKIKKYIEKNELSYMHDRILTQKLFGIESDFVSKNQKKVKELTPGMKIDFKREVKLFANDKAGKAGRGKWYITNIENIPQNQKFINEWQVAVSSANAGGQKRDSQMEIMDNHSAFGRGRVALASFKTKKEAENFFKYANSYLIKYTFLMTDEALTSLGKRVPDIMDYSKDSFIDFDSDIDKQLCKLIGLTKEDFDNIKNTVNSVRREDE